MLPQEQRKQNSKHAHPSLNSLVREYCLEMGFIWNAWPSAVCSIISVATLASVPMIFIETGIVVVVVAGAAAAAASSSIAVVVAVLAISAVVQVAVAAVEAALLVIVGAVVVAVVEGSRGRGKKLGGKLVPRKKGSGKKDAVLVIR